MTCNKVIAAEAKLTDKLLQLQLLMVCLGAVMKCKISGCYLLHVCVTDEPTIQRANKLSEKYFNDACTCMKLSKTLFETCIVALGINLFF